MFGELDHSYKDLDFHDYAFHANQVVNDKVTPQSYKLLVQMKKKNGNKLAKENMMFILKIRLENWCLLPQSSPKMEKNTLLCKACGDFELRLKMI